MTIPTIGSYPTVVEPQYAAGFDFEQKLKMATNILLAIDQIGCKAGVAVANPS